MIDVEVRLAARSEKDAVAQLLELYLHDLSELTAADVGAGGRYGYRYLDDYWTEVECHPFLFRVDDRLAGLALVQAGAPHDMSEFFVMRRYRRRGVGRRAALALFTRFPGEWQVRQLSRPLLSRKQTLAASMRGWWRAFHGSPRFGDSPAAAGVRWHCPQNWLRWPAVNVPGFCGWTRAGSRA